MVGLAVGGKDLGADTPAVWVVFEGLGDDFLEAPERVLVTGDLDVHFVLGLAAVGDFGAGVEARVGAPRGAR